MKQRILLVLLILLSGTMVLNAQVSLTATSGTTTGSYTTLGAAFAKINDGTHRGKIIITLTGSTDEGSTTATLYANGYLTASYDSVRVYPTVSNVTISGNYWGPLVDLNGADNVTFDGRVNATGFSANMTITNTRSEDASSSTIRFTNDATYNTVKYCVIKGSAIGGDKGILLFTRTATTSGNSNNTIDHNEITNNNGNRPRNALFSYGNSEAVPNSSNTVSNNHIYDILNLNQNYTKAIALYTSNDADPNHSYNTGWTISGNSFYDTQDVSASGSYGDVKVIFVWADEGSGFTISNNYFGGSAALCSGTWTKANGNNEFMVIWLNAKPGEPNYIQGNTIKNFNLTNSGASSWYGIYFNSGDNNVSNNSIGASTGTGSIIFTNGSTGGWFIGFNQGVYCSSTCNNNTIGSITVANSNPENATNFIGIWVNSYCGSATTSNNIVGGTTTPNSINATSASTSNAQTMVGIRIQGGSTLNIENNTVANLTNGTTNTLTSMQGYIYGIYPYQGTNTITGNIVHNLTIGNANDGTGPAITTGDPSGSLSAGGIVAPIYNGNNQTISRNTIYNISNSYSSFTGHVAGIYHYGQSAASSVTGNLIYGLSVSSSSSSANIHGIKIGQGGTTYSNNIITLDGTNSTIYGIYEAGVGSTTSNLYFNTVYLKGSPTSGSLNSACLYNAGTSSTRDFRNNIFRNARSNSGSASGTHYSMYISGSDGSLTCGYNDYWVGVTDNPRGYYGANKSSLPIVTGQDVGSQVFDPSFALAGGTNATDYIASAPLPAVTGTGITTDYGGSTRSLTSPEMGAWEQGNIITWNSHSSKSWSIAANWNPQVVPTASHNIVVPDGTEDLEINQSVSSPAMCNNMTIQSGAKVIILPGKALTVNGTLTNSSGSSRLVIESDETATGSLIQSSSSVGATVKRYITGSTTLTQYKYHMVSIPVNYASPTSNLFLGSYLYELDPTQTDPTNNNYYGLWHNMGTSTTNPLSCNSGYMIYYPAASTTYTFTGNLNTGNFSPTVSFGGTYTFNLVPNPYPSAINWGSSSGWVKNNIGATAYIWPAGAGNYTTITASSNYNIPAGQSFIVMTSGSPTLTVNNNACVHSSQAFYKSTVSNQLKISAQSNDYYDETFLSFNSSAGQEFDPQLDGFKLWGLEDAPQLWTEKGETRLSINQLPPPSGALIVPLDFKTSHSGQVILNVSGVESFDPSFSIRLKDHLTGSVTNLRQDSNYVFTYNPSNSEQRFSLVFGYPAGINSNVTSDCKAFISNSRIYLDVPSMQGELANIIVYDMLGQVIGNHEKKIDGIISIEAPLSKGVFIVSISFESRNFVTKIINK